MRKQMSCNRNSVGTFTPNITEPIHGWYPYVEGYSSKLVCQELEKLNDASIQTLYDPFAGTGTTPLVASQNGLQALYSETNPFMRFVIETKINSTRHACVDASIMRDLCAISDASNNIEVVPDVVTWDGFEKYFEQSALRTILAIRSLIGEFDNPDTKALAMLALSSIIVPASKMVRRGDLRFARESELARRSANVKLLFINKLQTIIEDINQCGKGLGQDSRCISADSRSIPDGSLIDCVITSPPYLNGTNYVRNTKLELKLNGFVKTEAELASLHSKGIVAGINGVSKATRSGEVLPEVKSYYDELLPIAYDKRIPAMVASYFRDMQAMFERVARAMHSGSYFIMDIGDSQFAGVHIPTHVILVDIARKNGFDVVSKDLLRKRRSKNGMELTQHVIRFRCE